MSKKKLFTRRDFIKAGLATGVIMGARLPAPAYASGQTGPRALVCIELLGGIDNFLFSFPTDTARKTVMNSRRSGITSYFSSPDALAIGNNIALHPGLAPLAPYLPKLRATLGVVNAAHVQASGSHEIQQIRMALGTELAANLSAGWKARMFDAGAQLYGFTGSRGQDFACQSPRCRATPPLVTYNLESYRLDGVAFDWQYQGGSLNTQQVAVMLDALSNSQGRPDSNERENNFRLAQRAMIESAADIKNTVDNYHTPLYSSYLTATPNEYTTRELAQRLRNIAQVLKRMQSEGSNDQVIFAVPLGSFDMHANFLASANVMMTAIGSSLKIFLDDLSAMGLLNNVVIQTETEFGRQIAWNGTGTDHGTAFTALTIGGKVNGGANAVWGEMLSPSILSSSYAWPQSADSVDSRTILAEIIEKHLGLDPAQTAFTGTISQEFRRQNLSLFV